MERKELLPKVELPMLEEHTGVGRNEKRKMYASKRFIMVYRLYLITSITLVVLCTVLLSVLIFGNRVDSFMGGIADTFAEWLARIDLMDLSGKWSEDSGGHDGVTDVWSDQYETEKQETTTEKEEQSETSEQQKVSAETVYLFDYSAVPEGETPILPMDLSLISYGSTYINNSTGLTPNISALLQLETLSEAEVFVQGVPTVLIIHTHGTESYSADGAISFYDNGSELARSENTELNMIAVGKAFAEELEWLGVGTVHCTIMHDKDGYRDAYARAEETVRQYLKKYPTIKLVIDLHRDSVVRSGGELIRPVTVVDGEAVAQVMCVVGSDWGGEANPNWEGNLALALQLREGLNDEYKNICRPTYLRPSTYNQELAPYSLLLEIGASGNSLEEAVRAARLTARTLAEIISKQ